MRINDIEYIAPSQANPIGSVKFNAEVPILYEEGKTKQVSDNDNADVELSPETQLLLRQLVESIIKDITK